MHQHKRRFLAITTALVLAVAGLSACGGDSDSSTTAANGVDRAFATEMIAHHQMAIEMARVAKQRSTRAQVKELADAIVGAQKQEITQLQAIDRRLEGEGLDASELGLSQSMMGMDMDGTMLMDAEPFDRMFIDMMIPHHQGAIRMARVQLARGRDPQLVRISKAVVATQSQEIEQMNAWRKDWYGGASPAGGVPAQDEDMSGEMEMPDHGM